jgi:flagellar motor switch protein FliN
MTDHSDGSASESKKTIADLRPDLLKWCEAWQTCFQNALTQVSGSPAGTAVFEISAEPLLPVHSDLWYTITAGGATRGEMTLRLPSASGTRLALKFLGEDLPVAIPPAVAGAPAAEPLALEAGIAETATDEKAAGQISAGNKEALEELLRQISGLAATSLAALAGGEVKFTLAPSTAPSWSSDAIVCLRTRDEAGSTIAIEIQISPALAASVVPKQPAPASPAKAAPAPRPVAPPAQIPAAPLPPNAANYNRLMDVGLEVKLRFGTRRMLLREVLALSAGIVIELDNPLHSPVELLLDGRLVAQGEVVVVDGKYGLRVTEVPDSQSAPGHASPDK